MITMTRIPVPDWAPSHARHVTKTIGELGAAAKATIAPLMPRIYQELDRRVNEFANDPDQCFQDSDHFPEQRKLDGRYYVGSESFEGNTGDEFFRVWLEVRCSEKPWHPNQQREGYDYLGLEAIVTVDRDGASFEFDDGFNTSSI
jgi:hypothetical protein